jgi:hypothetical protein
MPCIDSPYHDIDRGAHQAGKREVSERAKQLIEIHDETLPNLSQ